MSGLLRLRSNAIGYLVAILLFLSLSIFIIQERSVSARHRALQQSPHSIDSSEIQVLFNQNADLWMDKLSQLAREYKGPGPLIVFNITNIINGPQDSPWAQDLIKRGGEKIKPATTSPEKQSRNESVLDHFVPCMDANQKAILFETLQKVADIAKDNNYTYMMYSGTLLGSYRHHDMVPWDDDLDIFMNYTERQDIVDTLSNQLPEYEVWVAGARVKFFSIKGTQTSKYPWKWPYIDISFFKENKTHIWDGSMEDDYGDRYYCYPKRVVFPLHKRPLGKFNFDAPRDAYANLKRTYGPGTLNGCFTSHYSHKTENLTEQVYKVPCEAISHVYPFVHRSPVEGGVKETLKVGKKIIHQYIVDEPPYAISKPFAVELV